MENFTAEEGKTLGFIEYVWDYFLIMRTFIEWKSYILFNSNDNMLTFITKQNTILLVILFLNYFPLIRTYLGKCVLDSFMENSTLK